MNIIILIGTYFALVNQYLKEVIGEQGEKFYIILSGTVSVYIPRKNISIDD